LGEDEGIGSKPWSFRERKERVERKWTRAENVYLRVGQESW